MMRECPQDAVPSEKLEVLGIVYGDWGSLGRVGQKEERWRAKFK
jgi:hypothetical protein